MKKMVSFINLILFGVAVQGQTPNVCEGPYVFYRGDHIIIRSIDSKGKPRKESFSAHDKEHHSLSVCFSNHAGWDFTVPFRKEIKNEPCIWGQVDKLIAFSDIEGEFEAFRNLLIANQVMDSLYHWTFGGGHLVICGDLFDRGRDVAAQLWLLYKLEDEARESGGYVHTLLGNHDIMNLSGDLRYVQAKYFDRAKQMGVEYADFYDKDSELGRWLRSKNIIERIGDNLCLHGGISPEILALQWPLDSVNTRCRPFYDQGDHPENFVDKDIWKFFDGDNISPFWYRSYFAYPRATQGLVDSTLALYRCRRIIVGHDILDNVSTFYQGKVIGIDVNEHEGHEQGLLIEEDKIFRIDVSGKKTLLP
jgi:hypothetical protein